MTRHVVTVAALWIVLTAVGELLAFAPLFPTVGAKSAEEFDEIFRILVLMGIPVFMFVVAVLAYSMFQFRTHGTPTEAGPTYRGNGAIPKIWLAVTGTLAIVVMIYPGMTGLAHLQTTSDGSGWGDEDAELVVNVTAFQFSWSMEYEEAGVTVNLGQGGEMVLPIDTTVRFNVNSTDVVHSFWIPAFRMKIDAIPGRTTFFTVTPDRLGDYESDSAYRVQCAELCGLDHSLMRFPIRVVEQAEFEQWIGELQAAGR